MDIKIRNCEKDDIPAIKAIFEQPSCYAGTLQRPYPSLAKWEGVLGSERENFYSLVAEVDGGVAGHIGIEIYKNPRRKHAATLGMVVHEEFQGQGTGGALLDAMLNLAFNWLAVKRIELEVFTDNAAAIALYKSRGFEVEGTAKSYAFRDGEYVDAYFMSRLHP